MIIAFKLAQAARPSSVPVMRLVPLVVQEGFVWRNSTRSVSGEIRRCSSGKVGESGTRKQRPNIPLTLFSPLFQIKSWDGRMDGWINGKR